jgi:hypothetical protein
MGDKPDWASDAHLHDSENTRLSHCCGVPLEVEETHRLATWMGVNWEDGYEEIVRCPECNKRGQITTKLMNKRSERTRFSALGSAASKQEVQHG